MKNGLAAAAAFLPQRIPRRKTGRTAQACSTMQATLGASFTVQSCAAPGLQPGRFLLTLPLQRSANNTASFTRSSRRHFHASSGRHQQSRTAPRCCPSGRMMMKPGFLRKKTCCPLCCARCTPAPTGQSPPPPSRPLLPSRPASRGKARGGERVSAPWGCPKTKSGDTTKSGHTTEGKSLL